MLAKILFHKLIFIINETTSVLDIRNETTLDVKLLSEREVNKTEARGPLPLLEIRPLGICRLVYATT